MIGEFSSRTLVALFSVFVLSAAEMYSEKKISVPEPLNKRPIIGILAQHLGEMLPKYSKRPYIAASYVKFIQSAGGRVVPILTNHSSHELEVIFNSINGIVLPGGDAPLMISAYYKTARKLYGLATKANDKGDFFPIMGTCLGFQALHALRMDNDSIISVCSAVDESLKLELAQDFRRSRLFGNASPRLIASLKNKEITYNYHINCVRPCEYKKHEKLNDFFRIISTNRDRNGMEFISTVEAIKYPFYGVQWHPEKIAYEWSPTVKINHSPAAIAAAQYFANFFVSEARKSRHKFTNVEVETKSLIYNVCPKMTFGNTHFEQFYIF